MAFCLGAEVTASITIIIEMKIAIICEYFHPDNSGGTPTDLSELARCLKDRYTDIEIDILTSRIFIGLPG